MKQGFISAGHRYDFPQDIFENIFILKGFLDQMELYSKIQLNCTEIFFLFI